MNELEQKAKAILGNEGGYSRETIAFVKAALEALQLKQKEVDGLKTDISMQVRMLDKSSRTIASLQAQLDEAYKRIKELERGNNAKE